MFWCKAAHYGSFRQPSPWRKLVFLTVLVLCVSAAASGPISNRLGVDLIVTNLHGNNTIFASISAGNTTTCSGRRTTSSSAANTTTSSEIKPGESRSFKVPLDWSGLNICFRAIASNTTPTTAADPWTSFRTINYHSSLAFGNVKLARPICDNSLSNMKPGSDCSSFTCSSQDTSATWSCDVDDHGGLVIIRFSDSLVRSQEKGDGVVSSGPSSRIKHNHFLLYVCVLIVAWWLGW